MLIEELKKGSPDAFRQLVEQFSADVIKTCYSFVNSRDDAEDIAQEVFIEVYKSIRQFRQDSDIGTWIYRISINKSLDFLRRCKRKKRIAELRELFLQKSKPTISPVFEVTPVTNEGGKKDFPFYWTSTSHVGGIGAQGAVYVAFGRSLGWMQTPRGGRRELMDVHGAGSQRSDPKSGNPSQFPFDRGPQGDVIRIYNYVRCVRNAP